MRAKLCLAALSLSACVGTDYISDAPALPPQRLQIGAGTTALVVGHELALEAIYFDDLGVPAADVAITWSSSDPAIVSVSATGVVTGVREGQGTIVARAGDAAVDSLLIGVVTDPATQVATVRLSPEVATLSEGDSLRLYAESFNAAGETLAAQSYTWVASDSTVLHIDGTGTVRAVGSGRATVRATASGIASAPAEVMVLGVDRTGIFVGTPGHPTEGSAHLRVGDSDALVLEFSADFSILDGPQLEVFVSTTQNVGPGSTNLGGLQSPEGAQAYGVPDGIGLGDVDWVIVHCVPYNVTFGRAQLQ